MDVVIGIGALIVVFIVEVAFFRLCENISDLARDVSKIRRKLENNQIVIIPGKLSEYEKILNTLKAGGNPSKEDHGRFGLKTIDNGFGKKKEGDQ